MVDQSSVIVSGVTRVISHW